jgi:ATP-dependent RNA/DNA helicase IGHMBP2
MTIQEELNKTLELIRKERLEDLEQYRQKVLLTPLHRKTSEGICWYPVRLKQNYIGTGERLIIEVDRTNQLDQPHVFQSGKVVSIFSNAEGKPNRDHIGGVINYVRDNTMVITLNADDLPDWIDEGLLGVDVMFDEMSYREMEAAMKVVIKADHSRLGELRDTLLGKRDARFDETQFVHSNDLNASQQKALNKSLSARDVGIVHGPPGTGKTTTLVQVIRLAVEKEKQALVCAPSNAAIDLLSDKLSEEGLRVLRIGHPARVNEQSLSKTLDARIAAHEHYKELRGLRKRMEELRNMAFKYKRNYGYAERNQRRLLLQEAKAIKGDADVLEFYIVNDLIENSDVITCTLVGASHPLLRNKWYRTAFIDEAAQALEPACWIPIIRAERVIFAGDHCQLPPTIKSRDAANAGLSQTLFEKCIQRQPKTATMLQVQYRMHEDIMQFPSAYFYHGNLIAHESVRSVRLTPASQPVEFIDTAGCGFTEAQDPETLSRYNDEEALLVIRQVEKLLEEINARENVFTLGIITPYRAQVDRLKKLMEASPWFETQRNRITIDTVDAFQGQERDVTVLSFVRSNDSGEVGFLADIRRTNVAMTRARKKLILIGDSATLGSHPFYLELLDHVQQKGFYKSAWEVM